MELEQHLPFLPKRFYWIDHTDGQASRGAHCHWKDEEVMLALRGRFTVGMHDGATRTEFVLDRPDSALYVPAGVWHEVFDFRDGALCAVFASGVYSPSDDCRDYQEFLAECQRASQ